MKDPITDHHDGFGLAESMNIQRCDAAGPGGASHLYTVGIETPGHGGPDPEPPDLEMVARIQFQKGGRHDAGSTPGIIDPVLVAILLDRLRSFQAGDYACRENALAITKLEEALHWMQHRARERAKRGVLGTVQK
jgi:hypothetical protein